MRVAVTGETGFIGSHVVELLHVRGCEVDCLVLPGEGRLWLEGAEVGFFECSVTERGTLGPFLEGCDAIVNIAGLTRSKTEAGFMAVNVGGAVNLVEAALALPGGPRHILSMSSMAASGPCPAGRGLDEDDELRPLTPYGRSKAALETVLRAYEGRMACSFIRAPPVYGPRDRDFLQYYRLVKRGLRVIVGRNNAMSLLYVKNLAAAVAACVLNPAAYGQSFFIADDGECDWDGFSSMVEASLGRRTVRLRVPEPVVAAVAFCSEAVKPFLRNAPLIDRHKLLDMRQPRWVVSTAKAERLLGFRPAIGTAQAIAETGRWYEERGWI